MSARLSNPIMRLALAASQSRILGGRLRNPVMKLPGAGAVLAALRGNFAGHTETPQALQRIARQIRRLPIERLVPRPLRRRRTVRQALKTFRHGRRMTLYHTSKDQGARIAREGLRAGQGRGFGHGKGRIFLGTAAAAREHIDALTPGASMFAVNVRRGRLARDWNHRGSFVVRRGRLPRRLVRRTR